jgi:hypothetical protein
MIHPIEIRNISSSTYLHQAAEQPPTATVSKAISSRTAARHMLYRLAAAPTIAPRGVYVGELQERWQFPSDHLPIGMSIDGLKIASWNVLNPLYMDWVIEKNSQGLSRSSLAKDHVLIPGKKITVRESHVIDSILQMAGNGQSVIALQECGMPFLNELEARLPPHFKLVRENEGFSEDQITLLYDTTLLELLEKSTPSNVFSQDSRPFMDLLFQRKDGSAPIRIINAHVPGDPMGPARYEFASYVEKISIPGISTIALGDMNFNEIEMRDAFKGSSFSIHTPYCTNISPNIFISKAIDHFITDSPASIRLQTAKEVIAGLSQTISLLETEAK